MGSEKIKLDGEIYQRAKALADELGYSGVEELISHLLERELSRHINDENDEQIKFRLKGLGYIE